MAPRPVGHEDTELRRPVLEVALVELWLPDAQEPLALRFANRDGERPVVAARDDVDRLAHQRRLDDGAPLERASQIVARELLEA